MRSDTFLAAAPYRIDPAPIAYGLNALPRLNQHSSDSASSDQNRSISSERACPPRAEPWSPPSMRAAEAAVDSRTEALRSFAERRNRRRHSREWITALGQPARSIRCTKVVRPEFEVGF